MNKRFNEKKLILILSFFSLVTIVQACHNYELIYIPNSYKLSAKLSDYGIFQDKPTELIPAKDFKLYELSTPLFTDYSEKQRLIKLPNGTSMNYVDDKLPEFPDNSILVKTFFYYNDKRDTSKGKKLIETRILLKDKDKWNVGTYVWNKEQNEAFLQTDGSNQNISWIDEKGENKNIQYHIPATKECTTCHQQSKNEVLPIGPKLRNLNINVTRDNKTVNQLQYFQDSGMINTFDIKSVNHLPNWQDTSVNLNDRARAYLEVNCAHCHNNKGYAGETELYFNYELPFADTRIAKHKSDIIERMSAEIIRARMPKLGTSIIHTEGFDLIKAYIKSLK